MNDLAFNNDVNNVFEDSNRFYCSMVGETLEEKAKVFRAITNSDYKIADCINQTIYTKDVFCEVVDLPNQDGEIHACYRVVLIDKDGKSYQAVSTGIYNAVSSLFALFGEPTWQEPIPLKVKQINKDKKRMLTLDIDY